MSDMIKFDSMDDARAFTLGINAIIAAAVAEERAAVVAWLDAHLNLDWCDCCGQLGTTISEIANAIENGEHRREEGP